jgi:hypothetical protein
MKFPLGTSAGTVHSAPLLLIDLETEEGISGRTYLSSDSYFSPFSDSYNSPL